MLNEIKELFSSLDVHVNILLRDVNEVAGFLVKQGVSVSSIYFGPLFLLHCRVFLG